MKFVMAFVVAMGAFFTPRVAHSQQTCGEIEAVILQCADEASASGEPPFCFCDGIPVEPLDLTCEINFGCPTSSQVGTGDWPDCGCRAIEEVPTTGGEGGDGVGGGNGGSAGLGGLGVGGGLGGAAVCGQFFECPSGATLEVQGGQCTCTLVMLPAFRE